MIFKNKYIVVLMILSFQLASFNLFAAVKIDVNRSGVKESIWMEEGKLHIESGGGSTYTLIDSKQRQLHTVDNENKRISDLSGKVKQKLLLPAAEGISIEFVPHGAGPVMLGFETELYLLKVNGEICNTEYLSKAAELTEIVAGMELLTEYKMASTFSSLPPELDLCFVADHLSYERYTKFGFPIKSNDQFGKVQFELLSVDKNTKKPLGSFKLPENYSIDSSQ